MKILVIQLARLGDIYLTWPTLRAIHRSNPEAELHVMVRERFAGAMEGLDLPIVLHTFNTRDILAPVVTNGKLEDSLTQVLDLTDQLAAQKFDEIINLTFSPVSSYLVDAIKDENSLVRGYCRQTDGFLAIPDDASAYFYAQVGTRNWNRYHLGEVFAAVAGRDLSFTDWAPAATSSPTSFKAHLPENYFVVHLTTSQDDKSFPDFKWRQVLSKLIKRQNLKFVVVGGPEDQDLARRALAGLPEENVANLVGMTRIVDLFEVIQHSRGLIGCDSVGLHMASLCGIPCFNLSFASVNFWETGPRALGSRILWAQDAALLDSEKVVQEFSLWIDGEAATSPVIDRISNDLIGYQPKGFKYSNFAWRMIEAIYTGGPFPATENTDNISGIQKLTELSILALEQLDRISVQPKDQVSHQILAHIDQILNQLAHMVPEIRPLIAWFDTERLRMGPGEFQDVYLKTRSLFHKLSEIAALYANDKDATATLTAEGAANDNFNLVE